MKVRTFTETSQNLGSTSQTALPASWSCPDRPFRDAASCSGLGSRRRRGSGWLQAVAAHVRRRIGGPADRSGHAGHPDAGGGAESIDRPDRRPGRTARSFPAAIRATAAIGCASRRAMSCPRRPASTGMGQCSTRWTASPVSPRRAVRPGSLSPTTSTSPSPARTGSTRTPDCSWTPALCAVHRRRSERTGCLRRGVGARPRRLDAGAGPDPWADSDGVAADGRAGLGRMMHGGMGPGGTAWTAVMSPT